MLTTKPTSSCIEIDTVVHWIVMIKSIKYASYVHVPTLDLLKQLEASQQHNIIIKDKTN